MKLQVLPFLGGIRGTERTIAHMRKLVEEGKLDPRVVLKAQSLVRGIDRNNQRKMAAKLFKFVHDTISYVRDPVGVEFVKAPGITLKTRTGDCDDQSVLFSALAESVGIETRFKAVKADPRSPGEFSHVYSQAKIPGKGWMTADTIVPYAQFGWEATGFASRTWGGSGGMGFIDAQNAGPLGDAQLAAGSVGYDDDDDDNAFGAPFDPEYSGGMYDELPVLGEEIQQLSTIVDAPEDHWGGAQDLGPGPGLKSRMLPMGVGAMNGIRTEIRGGVLGYYDGMGRWRPFRRISDAIHKASEAIGKGLKTAGEQIKEGTRKLGQRIANKIGLSTPESRMKASQDAVTAALKPVWEGDNIQLALELLRRSEAIATAVREGKTPPYIKGPPPTSLQGFVGQLAQVDWQAVGTEVLNTGPLAPYTQAVNFVKRIGEAEDQKAAERSLKSFVEEFPQEEMSKEIQQLVKLYVATGGMLPSQGEKPPEKWLEQFKAEAKKMFTKDEPGGGTSGWYYWYLRHLLKRMKEVQPKLDAARKVLATAYKAHTEVAGKETIQTASNVVKDAIASGAISPSEVAQALEITRKVAQGYTLTPEERELAARVAAGARQPTSAIAKYGLPIAAAAGAAALLL